MPTAPGQPQPPLPFPAPPPRGQFHLGEDRGPEGPPGPSGPDSFTGPKASEGPGLMSQQSQDSSSGPPPCGQQDCARHEDVADLPAPIPRHLAPRQPQPGQTHAVCVPPQSGLLGSGPGPPPGNCQPGLAGPLGTSFHLGKCSTRSGPGNPRASLLFLAGGPAGLSSTAIARETEPLRALAQKSFPALEALSTLLSLCCASVFSSVKWG